MRKCVVFDRKKGLLGVKRLTHKSEEKEFSANYVVDILDPISFQKIKTVEGFGTSEYDWKALPKKDPRVQFVKLFDVIEGADWYYSGYAEGDGIQVEEAYIENLHAVFEQIRKIFEA